jgi:tetratricopeptide (TPR) repeat protein
MSALPIGLLACSLVLASAAPSRAQTIAECPNAGDCAADLRLSPATDSRLRTQLWQEATAIHQIKVAFVEALQQFVRAQAGTFGDEGQALRAALDAMRLRLTTWDGAIDQFQNKWSRTSRDADVPLALASVWLDRHRLDAALRELDAAERRDDRRVDLYMMRALASGTSGRYEDAVPALRKAAALEPDNPTLWYGLAQYLTRLQQPDEAARALRRLQRTLDARRGGTGTAVSRPPRFERVDLLRQVSGAAPVFPQSRYAAGFLALASADYAAALARFGEAVDRDPIAVESSARAQIVEAASALKGGQIQAALERLRAAAETSPSDGEVHRALGLAYWVDGQSGKSIEHLRSAIRLSPQDERPRVLLADVLAGDRRLAEAERELTQAADVAGRSGQIAYRLAQLAQRQSLLPQAAAAFRDSESFGPVIGRDYFYQSWGSLLVNQADFDGAVTAYQRRIEVNGNNAEAHRQLGEIYFLQGRNDEALAEFSVAVWLDPTDARAHAGAGQVYGRSSRYADAIAALQRALALDATLREARYALGTALMRAGRADDGRRELETFARLQAEAEANGQLEFQLDALRRQASKALLSGDYAAAVARFEEALRVDPASARSHRDLGLTLLRAQRPREAVGYLLEAQRIEETAEGHRYLADGYSAMGDAEQLAKQRALTAQFVMREKMERVRELSGR